jgi:hypothetical protein
MRMCFKQSYASSGEEMSSKRPPHIGHYKMYWYGSFTADDFELVIWLQWMVSLIPKSTGAIP